MNFGLPIVLILFCMMLSLTINLIWTLHSLVMVPLCHLPGPIRTSFICTKAIIPATPNSSPVIGFICWIPGFSYTAVCGGATGDYNQLSSAVEGEFGGLVSLHNTTSIADGVIFEVGSATEAIRDLIILVRNSNIKNKAAIIELLQAIIKGGNMSCENLNAYVARVSASVTAYVLPFIFLDFWELTLPR